MSSFRRERGSIPLIPLGFLAFMLAVAIRPTQPWTVLWAGSSILFAAVVITWGAEAAQFFMAQGFALAILALLQTLPEFAVEAVLAWHQQVTFLFANLTGALRMLTGLGWPMIYFAAATVHRKRTGKPLERIRLDAHHSVEVVALLAALIYMSVVAAKGALTVVDGLVLIGIYAGYLLALRRMPPEDEEGIEELEAIPRAIVLAPRPRRIALISLCFVVGGGLIYLTAEPFLSSLMALAVVVGIPSFVFIQWVAPFVSEFPEMASTFYFARTVTKAPMALMNMVSSNINQWTLLTALLPMLYSFSRGGISPLVMDEQQKLEIVMTLGQALVGWFFLLNMELAWWEAAFLFVFWLAQFILSAVTPVGHPIHWYITIIYFMWAALEFVRLCLGQRKPAAFVELAAVWRERH